MNEKERIIVVGGGYAGINLVNNLQKIFHHRLNKDLEIILVDKNAYHFKKVKLFKVVTGEGEESLKVPLTKFCGPGVRFVQGELTAIDQENQMIEIKNDKNDPTKIKYDRLVLALGSTIREADAKDGGRTLDSLQSAGLIRRELLQEIQSGKGHLRIAIAGAGITGIETAAEIAAWLKTEAATAKIEVLLLNDKERLLSDVPEKVSCRLEERLNRLGVQTLHGKKAETFSEGKIILDDGSYLDADYCIWTVGVKPHPCLGTLGLPMNPNGKVKTDSWYRLENSQTIYAIGDCVHICDPTSGAPAGMSCKEAVNQAGRLAKIIIADLEGKVSEGHKTFPNTYCIGLGPEGGFVWTQKWGIDFVLAGKLGAKIRDYTWNFASLME